jgi:phosphoglycerate dehydrogenase-like enzyme
MKLVISPPVEAQRLEKIVQAAGDMSVVNAESEQAAVREIADADALFGKITPPMLSAAKKLKWVQSATASLEHYMFPELIEHPCTLTNMRGLYSDVIADHVFSYILCFARNLHRYIRQQMRAHWEPIGGEPSRATFAAGVSTVSAMDREHLHLSDCVLGIVGLGNIGGEIARRGRAFGMRVVAVDPIVPAAPEEVETLWRPQQLRELLAVSDFVVIAAPHTPETVKMFRRAQFGQMKSTAYLINIGRGVIVDLADLTDALRAGQIRGAALDVFEVEPLPADHPLWQMENVLITPHVAAASVHIAERHLAVVLDNIRRFVSGRPLENVTRKDRWF